MNVWPGGASPWFEQKPEGTPGTIDVALFPYAGGNPTAFRSWHKGLSGARLLVASLPGRGARFGEMPVSDFDTLVDILVEELEPLLRPRFALFGHSLGAYVGFEVACRLSTSPAALFVSGADSPAVRIPPPRRRATLSDAELLDELRRLGGTPAVVLENEELLELLMPSIRADFELVDSYVFRPESFLDCPIHVLGGEHDAHTSREGLQAWERLTVAEATLRVFPGEHFFVHDVERDVRDYVARTLGTAQTRPLDRFH